MTVMPAMSGERLAAEMRAMGARARAAASRLAVASGEARNRALALAAAAIRARSGDILAANRLDIAAARATGLSAATIDRTALDAARVEAIARGIDDVVALPDPVGATEAEWTQPNGLRFARVRVPIGVVGAIYEARPNVTADAGSLCVKAGSAAILRGGSEAFESSRALAECLRAGLAQAGLPEDAIQFVPTRDRDAVGHMLAMHDTIDAIVPRGGKSLIARTMRETRIPVIAHLEGLCCTYVHAAADPAMAVRIVVNAKMRRVSVCGATETVLIDRACAATHLKPILAALLDAGCAVRGDPAACAADARVEPAGEADWSTEFLDAVVALGVVDGLDAAIAHIGRYGSRHTDAIVTEDRDAAERFLARVDSAIVLHNASTQFADGGEFGFGAEIGIATGRLPPRGPVGAEQLTTYKYVVRGGGQTRP